MVSVVIRDQGEPNVTQYTFEKLYTELKDIPGSDLLIKDKWEITGVRNRFVCFVEADCLVSKGYFKNMIETFKALSPRVIVLSSSTAVKYWQNKIYGYSMNLDSARPHREQKGSHPYPVQIGFIPGALMRTSSLKRITLPQGSENDLVYYSSKICLGIWDKGIRIDPKHPEGQLGSQVYINPACTYATTEEYVNDIGNFGESIEGDLLTLFSRESI